LCNRAAERVGLDEVREPPPAVDLHDGQPLAIRLLQMGYAGDVDLPKLEPELVPELSKLLECALAEVTAPRVVERDLRLTGRCHA
jgi:hypothetical protein